MTIRNSLLLGLCLLTLLGALEGGAALIGNKRLSRSTAVQAARLIDVNTIASAQLAFERADRAASMSKRAPDPMSARKSAARFRAQAALALSKLADASRSEPGLAPLSLAAAEWMDLVDKRLLASRAGPQASILREDLLMDRRDSRQQEIDTTLSSMLRAAAAAQDMASGEAAKVQAAILGLVLISGGGGLLLAWLLQHRVLRPMARLTSATHRLAAGDFSQAIEETARGDEIGEIASALEALRSGTLRARAIEAEAAAERAGAEAKIHHMAHHDSLTGLANRALFRVRLENAIEVARRTGTEVALFCIDLDRFKAVNDSRGHAAGDLLLCEVGRRLSGMVRYTDTVARLGGDEFVLLQVEGMQPGGVEGLARRITESLAESYDIGNGDMAAVTASVGVAISPHDGETAEALLANADIALYRAKRDGRNGHAFFRADMDAQAQLRRLLEQDLGVALALGELTLAYQPQADVRSNRVVGFEALLRWDHPGRGSVAPEVFIPIAEATGAIVRIGAWVLREACLEAMRWDEPLRIAINVSPVQFHGCEFAELVAATLVETGLPADRLELEVTEGIMIHDTAGTLEILRQIRTMGVGIAMDDFGTGYSSLSTLRAFPFDRIKVDRSFVKDLATHREAAAIVHAVLGLAKGLRLPVVAEGVENEEQMGILREGGCAEAQGYLIGKPAGIESFAQVTHPGKVRVQGPADGRRPPRSRRATVNGGRQSPPDWPAPDRSAPSDQAA